MTYTLDQALELDQQDPLSAYRDKFWIPLQQDGTPYVYLCGNSLGLQPKITAQYLQQELEDWKNLGVEGHFHAKNPWMPYHEFLTADMAKVVGAKPSEVVVMNTLSVNIHLLMVSFYRPSKERYKIIMEADAFPSDRYAIESQIKFHGYDPSEALVELKARPGEVTLREEDIYETIHQTGDALVLVLLGGVNYYTGQAFDMKTISSHAHQVGAMAGFDLAHMAGNIDVALHDSGADFAAWCTYKYLNSGPGSIAGAFVHERHHQNHELPRFAGWWGHDKSTRFNMRHDFKAIESAEGWQLSNPPILSLAAIRASLAIFAEVGMEQLRERAWRLTQYLRELLAQLPEGKINVITPPERHRCGAQLSIQIPHGNKAIFEKITADGVIADWREPDVIRVAPAPLYNSYEDCHRFFEILRNAL